MSANGDDDEHGAPGSVEAFDAALAAGKSAPQLLLAAMRDFASLTMRGALEADQKVSEALVSVVIVPLVERVERLEAEVEALKGRGRLH